MRMNRLNTWMTGAAFSLAGVLAAPAGAAIQDDLISLWQMDTDTGTAAVDSVNANNGVWQGGADDPDWVAGQIGNAVGLNGASTNHFIVNEITQMDGATGLTISGWVNTNNVTGYDGIFMTRTLEDSAGTGANWGLAREGNSTPELHIDGRVRAGGFDSANGSVVPDTWHHAVITWNNTASNAVLYLDGVSVDSNASSLTSIVDSGLWYIGEDNCCDNRNLNGEIDDLGVWRRSLSADEVATLHERGQESISAEHAFSTVASSLQNGLLGHWSFDQAAFSDTAYDSKSDNDAVLSGGEEGTRWVDGKINGALSFDGSNDAATINEGIVELNGSSEMTLSIWVFNEGSNENNEGIFQHRDLDEGTFDGDFHGLNTPGGDPNDIQARINRVAALDSDPNELPLNQWAHVLQVYKQGEYHRLYIDGVIVAELLGVDAGTVDTDPDSFWVFGNDACCSGRFFNGLLDDAGLWNRALSEAEILAIYNGGLEGLNLQQISIPTPAAAVGGLVLLSLLGLPRRKQG